MLPPPALAAGATTLLEVLATATITPTAALTLAAALSTPTAGSANGPHHPPPEGECKLLGPFALIVQAALGGLALLALVYKRWRERPQRPLKIWWFDVSKQVVGSVLVHVANLVMSMLSSGQLSIKLGPDVATAGEDDYSPNPCSFYLLNLGIDTTIGIPILIFLLRLLTVLFSYTSFGSPPESIRSGHYGSPPRALWWAKQSLIYFLGLLGMKICVLIIFLVLPWISRVGDWALRWTEGDERLQVFFVMLFFPVIMNATQYYVIDGFIKGKNPEGEHVHEPLAQEDVGSDSDGEEEGEGEVDTGPLVDPTNRANGAVDLVNANARSRVKPVDYDPQVDGESSPTVVGSSSNSSERVGLLGKGVDGDDEGKPLAR